MQNPTNVVAAPEPETSSEPTASRVPWHAEVGALLNRAAELCVEHGLDADTFMTGAWTAYIESRPGLREHLEELQLLGQLDELRKLGRLGQA